MIDALSGCAGLAATVAFWMALLILAPWSVIMIALLCAAIVFALVIGWGVLR